VWSVPWWALTEPFFMALSCRGLSVRLDDCMDERVCVARPKVERLSVEMEREAVGLLAALLADAVRKDDAVPRPVPSADTHPSNMRSNSSSNTSSIPSSN
jgi:hypothetical protein